MTKQKKGALILTLSFIVVYVLLYILNPASLIQKTFSTSFNNPDRINSFFHRSIIYLIIIGVIAVIFLYVKDSRYWQTLNEIGTSIYKKFSSVFNLNILLALSITYLIVLYILAISRYDLGIDEAWYIVYAKNFSATGMPFYSVNGKLAAIDTISMLPFYIFSLVLFKSGLTGVVSFKFLSSLLSVITLLILFKVTYKIYGKSIGILFLFILISQPGFGFIASSFFGELVQAGFLFYGIYIWLKDDNIPGNKNIILTALLFSLAIHTKFQLIIILPLCLLLIYFTDKNKKPLKVLLYIAVFTALITAVRIIPILINDPKLIIKQFIIAGFFDSGTVTANLLYITDRLNLFSRFFQITVFLIPLAVFYFYMKTPFERFLFIFSVVTSLWWIFLTPLWTYRNPFMAMITLSVIIAILLKHLYESFVNEKNIYPVKYAAAVISVIYMFYGFGTNIIDASVGYNDGVQFNLDGSKNRLYRKIAYDNSQKEFYSELNKIITQADTLYNGTFVTSFYCTNPQAGLIKLKESLDASRSPKYVLITREVYPLGLQDGYTYIDSLNVSKKLLLKKGDFEMYELKK